LPDMMRLRRCFGNATCSRAFIASDFGGDRNGLRALGMENSVEQATPSFLRDGGEMGALMRANNWTETPLGPPEMWSPSLKMMVSLLLANRFPQLLWWGPDYLSIYNDAYRPVLGARHPAALGQPFHAVWPEVTDVLKPLIDTPFHGGQSSWTDDTQL